MSVSRRNESFRYKFTPDLPCTIQLYEVNNSPLDSKQGQARLIDLSSSGCKFESQLDFKIKYNVCKVILNMGLSKVIELRGTLIWQEKKYQAFHYGVRIDSNYKNIIIEELKAYSKIIKHPSSPAYFKKQGL